MRTVVSFFVLVLCSAVATAQMPGSVGTLRVTVVDPSGAVIVGARDAAARDDRRSARHGRARRRDLHPARNRVATRSRSNRRIRAGRASAMSACAPAKTVERSSSRSRRLAETVQVGRDARERASDPRSDAFATILSQQQIDELPDDPDEMEQMLQRDGGSGRGAARQRLPRRPAAAQGSDRSRFASAATCSPPTRTSPGSCRSTSRPNPASTTGAARPTSAFATSALNARNAFAPSQRRRAARALRLLAERSAVEEAHLAVALGRRHRRLRHQDDRRGMPSGYFADSIRKPNDALNVTARLEHALSKSQMLRVEASAQSHDHRQPRASATSTSSSAATNRTRNETVLRASTAGAIGKALYNEFRLQWRGNDAAVLAHQRGAGRAGAECVQRRRRAARRRARHEPLHDSPTISTSRSGRHAIRTGLLLDAGRYRTDELRNTGGTFTFASLDAYAAGTADDIHAQRRRSTA